MKTRDFLIIIIFFFPFFSCNADNPLFFILNKTDSSSSPKSNINSSIKAVNFDLIKELTIKVGEERFLIPTITYKDSNTSNSNQDVTWSSEDPIIVSVDKGKIKALKSGSVIIYAKSNIDASKYYSLLIKVPEEVVQAATNPNNNSTSTTIKPSTPVAQTTVYVTQTV